MNKNKNEKNGEATTVVEPKRYEEAYKRQAVEHWMRSEKNGTQIAKELGICYPSLKEWKRRYGGSAAPQRADLEAAVRAVHAELARVREQRDILKKTLGRGGGRDKRGLAVGRAGHGLRRFWAFIEAFQKQQQLRRVELLPRAARAPFGAAYRQAISLRSVRCSCQRAAGPARRASAAKASPPATPGRAHPSHRQVARPARLRGELYLALAHPPASALLVSCLLYS